MSYAPDAFVPDYENPGGPEASDKPGVRRVGANDVVRFVEEHYNVHATPAGEAFALPHDGPQLPIMLERKGGKLTETVAAALYAERDTVVSTKVVEDAMRIVIARARQVVERHELHLRAANLGRGGLVVDLGQPASARCILITAAGWSMEENPPPGTWFRRTSATRPLPTPASGGSLDLLRELLSFDDDDHRWKLVRGWLVASCFPGIPRPMLLALGAPGSAKTTRAKLIVNVLDPRQELGSAFGKNLEDDQVKALGRYLVSYDNLTGASEAISDHLCRLVTGDEIDRRVRYSDNELVTMSYRRTGALTAVTMPPLRADALERVVVLGMERIPEGHRVSEDGLKTSFERDHASILGGLCDDLVRALKRLPAARDWPGSRPRMSDYHDVLLALDDTIAAAYREAAEGAMIDAAESDPFVAAVTSWLAEQQLPWTGETTAAWRAASTHRESLDGLSASSATWWPKDATRFAAALTAATEPLRAVGYSVTRRKTNGRRVMEFTAVPRVDAVVTAVEDRDADPANRDAETPSVPASVPAISAGQGSIGPNRDARDAAGGSHLLIPPGREEGKGLTPSVPANSVLSVPSVPAPAEPDHMRGIDPAATPALPAHLADIGDWWTAEPDDPSDRDGDPDQPNATRRTAA